MRAVQVIAQAVRPLGIHIRAGVHTGEIERVEKDIGGVAVHIAERITSLAPVGGSLVSSIVIERVSGSDIAFVYHGEHALKGVPGSWQLCTVKG